MRTILISGSDTDAGKTCVAAALARRLSERGARVRLLKPVQSGRGRGEKGDAEWAAAAAGLPRDAARTANTFAAPLAPRAAARAEGRTLDWDDLIAQTRAEAACDWLLIEGAGGIAVPLAEDGRDWADFAAELEVDAVVLVVPDRLGAINQARLTFAYARTRGLRSGVVLNETVPASIAVRAANRDGLRETGVVLWGELAHDSWDIAMASCWSDSVQTTGVSGSGQAEPDWPEVLRDRERRGLLRRVAERTPTAGELDMATNDYLRLSRDPELARAANEAVLEYGVSSSASPLVSGWRRPHAELVQELCEWHGFSEGLLWSSGYAANSGVLGTLPRAGDLVLADRLIHNSMVAGILKSGARLQRYPHLDLDALAGLLARAEADERSGARRVFVATESVFGMDGDYPDLRRIAELRRRYGFCWVLDEAHAIGWYGRAGAGLASEAGVASEVDILVGTGGKALGACGGYTLFNGGSWRDALVNFAGEFIYSTALPPPVVAAAAVGVKRVKALADVGQTDWRAASRDFRARLRAAGWDATDGDSPVVPVRLGTPEQATELAKRLREAGVLAAAVRPPTVPSGTSRLRFSLNRFFNARDAERVIVAMGRPCA